MNIDRELHIAKTGEENKGKARNYVWCNISTAIKQNFVAHQFRFYEGSAYNITQSFEYAIDKPFLEKS